MKTMSRLLGCCLAVLMLAGCEKAKQLFSDEDMTPPLKGERISVLQLQGDLVPNPDLQNTPVVLPEPWINQFWPQRGGYPNHALGHLALSKGALKRVWTTDIGAGGNNRTPLTAVPIVAEDTVYALDTDGQISAFNLATGDRKWRQGTVPSGEKDTGAVGGGLAYSSGRIFVTNGYRYLVAVKPDTGAVVWKSTLQSPSRGAPTVMNDKVYVVTLDNSLLVFNAQDGTLYWKYTGVSETTNLLGSASPAADESLVVLPLSSGEIYGLRPENGQVVWEDNLSAIRRAGSLASISDIKGLPVIDQGVVYAVSFSGRMVALDQITGRRLWQREIGSSETPWAAGETVFIITSAQQIAALSRATGDVRWVTQLPRYEDGDSEEPVVWTGPVLAGGRLFAVSNDGIMAVVNPQDGKVLGREKLGAPAYLPPVVANSTLIVLTRDGQLRAYR